MSSLVIKLVYPQKFAVPLYERLGLLMKQKTTSQSETSIFCDRGIVWKTLIHTIKMGNVENVKNVLEPDVVSSSLWVRVCSPVCVQGNKQ